VAVGAEVPLQVADPQHHFGDGGGSGVDFDAEELVRVDGVALHFEQVLAGAQVSQGVEHFAFQAFHVLEGDVEEVGAAAGRVEDADVAELAVEVADFVDGLVGLSCASSATAAAWTVFPFFAQRVDDGGHDQAFDVGAGV
jgi:hypothetical protein